MPLVLPDSDVCMVALIVACPLMVPGITLFSGNKSLLESLSVNEKRVAAGAVDAAKVVGDALDEREGLMAAAVDHTAGAKYWVY